MYNEMSDREKRLNLGPLSAYETMKADIVTKNIPGFEKRETLEKDNFRRFNRKGLPQTLLGQELGAADSLSLFAGDRGAYDHGGSYTARDT